MKYLLLVLALTSCAEKPEEKYFKMPFGKGSNVEVLLKEKAPASLKEYKLATGLSVRKR